MKKSILLLLLTVILFSCSTSDPKKDNWIGRSNKIAEEYALEDADRYPEGVSSLGYRQYDDQAMQLEDDMESKDLASQLRWSRKLKTEMDQASDQDYKLDMRVLYDSVQRSIRGMEIGEKYGEIPFTPGSKMVFNYLRMLINDQSDVKRKAAAITRFKAYVNGHGKFRPILEASKSRTLYAEKRFAQKRLMPLKAEVEKYLSETADYLAGIEGLLQKSGRNDWQEDFAKFKAQLADYDKFVREHVLKSARTDFRLPPEYYSHILTMRGINASAEEVYTMARADYKTTYKKFELIAKKVALKHKLPKSDPVSVIKFLKQKVVTDKKEVQKLYGDADALLMKIITENDLISMPSSPLKIRIADEAESKASPIPHLNPPPLIDNKGERPEFVVPSSKEKLPFDDFAYMAAALVLTAHEGRPGHDLQFSSMLDNGVSTIRANFAFNSTNVEGWALYAEDMIFDYIDIESQLAAVQMRLWRIARAFLDPELQLGRINEKEVIRVFTKELGVSRTMAGLELNRYTYDIPGQAATYYFGLKLVQKLKEKMKSKLGADFTEKCFNDGLVSMGLLPIELSSEVLEQTLTCKN